MKASPVLPLLALLAGLPPRLIASADFDGDGTADLALYRPAAGFWAVRSLTRIYLGAPGDLPAPGDYDGDGTSEAAVFRPASSRWAIRSLTRFYLGRAGDLPVPGDYDGDGTEEGAVFRRSSALWAVRGAAQSCFGAPYDCPAPGDYDGDGKTERAVYRPELALWAAAGCTRFFAGSAGDHLLLDDFDGDGTAEGGVFRAASGLWALPGRTRFFLGGPGDLPQPAGYSGAAAAAGIFRPASGLWAIRGLTRAYQGTAGDLPVVAPLFRAEEMIPPFGVEVGRSLGDSYYLEALLATGASRTRKNYVSWARLEPADAPPEDYYWEIYDGELSAAGAAGLKTILVVCDSPSWAAPTACGPITAESLPAFGDFLFALVSRYARDPYRIKDYELFNEPDGTEPWYGATINCWGRHGDRYAEMLMTAYPAIKSADPESRVILGGLACDWFTDEGGIFQREFLADVLAYGGGGYFDVLNFHYYYFHIDAWAPYGRDVAGKANYLSGVLASGGVSKPMICTEVGIWGDTTDPSHLELQASYVPQVNARGRAAGLESVVWYPLIDGFTPYHGGLIEEDGRLKPAFSAYTTLAAELDGCIYGWTLSPAETGSPAIEGYGFASRSTGKAKRVLWAAQTTVMSFPFSRIRVVDRRGPERIVSDGGEGDGDPAAASIQIPISPQPVYVEEWN